MRSGIRTISAVVPLLTIIGFEVLFRYPSFVWRLAVTLPLAAFAAIWYILGPGLKTPSSRFNFLITPAILMWSALGFSLLLESNVLRHILAIIVAIFLVLFFESLALYVWRHEAYEAFSLENLSGYANTFAVFLLTSTLFGFSVLTDVPEWLLMLVFICAMFLLSHELLWISKMMLRANLTALMTVTLVALELYLALLALPLHFMASGAALTLLWYTAMVLIRTQKLGMLTVKMVKRHVLLAGVLLLVLLGTARWV